MSKQKKLLNVQEFAHSHRNYLVIVCDPTDDSMFMSYRDKQISSKFGSASGQKTHIVKRMLKASTFERDIDKFIIGVAEKLKVPLDAGKTFYAFLDGGISNIAKSLKKSK